RPRQSDRRREPVARAISLADEFVREGGVVASLELVEVDTRRRHFTQDVDDAALDMINLDYRRGPLPAHDASPSDRFREKARPVVRLLIQRANAVCGRVHVLADDSVNLQE